MVTLEAAGGPLQSPLISLTPHKPVVPCQQPPLSNAKAMSNQRCIVRQNKQPGTTIHVARYSPHRQPTLLPAKPTMTTAASPVDLSTSWRSSTHTAHRLIVHQPHSSASQSVVPNCLSKSVGPTRTTSTHTTAMTTLYISSQKHTKKQKKNLYSYHLP